VSARRYVAISLLALAPVGFAGCTEDEKDQPMATKPAASAPDEEPVAPAQAPPVRLLRLGSFNEPTYLAAPAGERRRFVVEREGTIRIVQRGRVLGQPFLDISDRVTSGGESGLLSMAFARDYASTRRFYVYYTDGQGFLQIDQFRASAGAPNRADPSSRRSVFRVPHHRSNHKGGQLQIGSDGMLYAGFGDGGGGGDPDENAQNLSRILGKMIRIEPRPGGGYSVPADNPLRGRPGARPEIYAYGLRNPYRFSFDRRRGDLVIGDVGQDAIEEIDYVPGRAGGRPPRGGNNFGWDVFEGRSQYEGGSAPGHVPPVIQHSQDAGFCSIIGGYVIRDRSLGRGWIGRYVYGDYCEGTIRLARLGRPGAPAHGTRMHVDNLVSFGEDGRGRVYAVSLDGPVYRIGRR
jgi:glucose/arabinose dehydrogenase